eukprot:gene3424-6795_t
MSDPIGTIRQLTNRLENATNTAERIETLRALKTVAKTNALEVGKHALQRLVELLKEQGIPEEYEEALELIGRLVKSKDQIAAATNTAIILSDTSNVELLLDLLEHADPVVGVMTSEILTAIHSVSGGSLELAIQECPAGMNKLLQRLPDASREEVRNQAILLVQQLTASNEEMQKTVAFNEGFDILFGIIRSEGGATDPTVVVQDCLRICSNILHNSETCQRLFYGMDGGWHLRLLEFFDPNTLENLQPGNLSAFGLEDEEDSNNGDMDVSWFLQKSRLNCAIMAIKALADSQTIPNEKHQNIVAGNNSIAIITAAAFWIARLGPIEITNFALLLLENVVRGNAAVSANVSSTMIRISPPKRGKDIPDQIEVSLSFGWKPLTTDERRFITVPTLLADRYVFGGQAWSALTTTSTSTTNEVLDVDGGGSGGGGIPQGCLRVLDAILAADSTTSGLVMQHILAPPPPSPEDEISGSGSGSGSGNGNGSSLETMRPFGVVLLNTLVEGCARIIATHHGNAGGGSGGGNILLNQNTRIELLTASKCANLLTLVFIHGGHLARELSTAISTSHTSLGISSANRGNGGVVGSSSVSSVSVSNQSLLPFLLSTAGCAARVQGGGYALMTAILRMLSVAATECERAVKQMLEDPSNLFVIDLATAASEGAGVPPAVQILSCLFLGCCLNALPKDSSSSQSGQGQGHQQQYGYSNKNTMDDISLSQKSIITMIDSRIGLTRFTDMLKRPLQNQGKSSLSSSAAGGGGGTGGGSNLENEIFFSQSFKVFYEEQIAAIRQCIFDFYSTGTQGGDSPESQLIRLQKDEIMKLENQIQEMISGDENSLQFKLQEADKTISSLTDEIELMTLTCKDYVNTIDNLHANESTLLSLTEIQKQRADSMEQNLKIKQEEYIELEKQLSSEQVRAYNAEIKYHELVNKTQTESQLQVELQESIKRRAEDAENRLQEVISQMESNTNIYNTKLMQQQELIQAGESDLIKVKDLLQTTENEYKSIIAKLQLSLETSEISIQNLQSLVNQKDIELSSKIQSETNTGIAEQQLQSKIIQLQSDLSIAQNHNEILQNEMLKLRSELETSQSSLEACTLEMQRLHENIIQQEQTNVEITSTLSIELKEQKQLVISLQESLLEVQHEKESLQSQIHVLQSSLEGLEASLHASMTEKNQLLTDKHLLDQLLEQKDKELSIRNSNESSENLEFQNRLFSLQEELKESSSKIAIKDKEIEEFKESLAAIEEQLTYANAVESELRDELQATKEILMNTKENLSNEISRAAAMMEASTSTSTSNKDLTIESESKADSTSDVLVESMKNELLELQEQIQEYESKIQKLENDFKNSEMKNLSLKENILEQDVIIKEKTNESDVRLRRINLIEEELKALVAVENDKDTKITNLEDRNKKLTQQIWQLESDLESSKLEISRLLEVSSSIETSTATPTAASTTPLAMMTTGMSHDNVGDWENSLLSIITSLQNMIHKSGINEAIDGEINVLTSSSSSLSSLSNTFELSEQVSNLISGIEKYSEKCESIITLCSDSFKRQIGVDTVNNLQTVEGTFPRVLELIQWACVHIAQQDKVIEEMRESTAEYEASHDIIQQLQHQLDQQQHQLLHQKQQQEQQEQPHTLLPLVELVTPPTPVTPTPLTETIISNSNNIDTNNVDSNVVNNNNVDWEGSFSAIVSYVTEMAASAEIDIEEELEKATSTSSDLLDRVAGLISALERYSEVYRLATNHCSDSLQSVNETVLFDSEEGAVARILECIDMKSTRISQKDELIDEMQSKLNELESENSILYSKLESEVAMNLQLDTQLQVKKDEIQTLEEKMKVANVSTDIDVTSSNSIDLSPNSISGGAHEQEIKYLKVKVDRLNVALEVSINDLTISRQTYDTLSTVHNNLKIENNNLGMKIKELENQLFDITATKVDIEKDYSKIISEYEVTKGKFDQLSITYENLNKLENKLSYENNHLQLEIASMKQQFNSLQSDRASLEEALVVKTTELEILQQQLQQEQKHHQKQLQDQHHNQQEEKPLISVASNIQNHQLEITTRQLLEANKELEELKRKLAKAMKNLNKYKEKDANTTTTSADGQIYTSTTTSTASERNSEVSKLFQDFEQLQKQFEKEKVKLSKAEAIIHAKNQEIENLKRVKAAVPVPAPSSSPQLSQSYPQMPSPHNPNSPDYFAPATIGYVEVDTDLVRGSTAWHQRQLERLMKEVALLRKENEELQCRPPVVIEAPPKSDSEMLRDNMEIIERLRLDNVSIQSQLRLEKAVAQRLQQELDDAHAELNLDASMRECPMFPANANAAAIMLSDTSEGGAAAVLVHERDALFRDNKKLREKLEARTKEIELVRQDTKISEEIRHKASLLTMKEELTAAKNRIEELLLQLSKLENLPQEIELLSIEKENHLNEIEAAHLSLKNTQRKLSEVEVSLDLRVSEISTLKLTIIEVQQERDELRLQLDKLRGMLYDKDSKINEVSHEFENKEHDITRLQKTFENLQKELLTTRALNELNEKKMEEMQETSSGVISGLVKKVENLSIQLKDKMKIISILEQENNSYKLTIESLNSDISSLKQRSIDNEIAHSSVISSMIQTQSDEAISSAKKIGLIELNLTNLKTEKESLETRLEASIKRYEMIFLQLQDREEELKQLQSTYRIEKITSHNTLALSSQSRITALTQISRAVDREFSIQFSALEQRTQASIMHAETKLSRFQRRVFSFVSAVRVQKKDRAQVKHIEKLLHYHQLELNTTK